MWGAIIGDIVGSRFEFSNCQNKQFSFFSTACRFTDDTVLTLAVKKALQRCGRASEEALRKETIRCMQLAGRKYDDLSWGTSFANWLKEDRPQPYYSYGNGAAMRISGVGEYAESEEEVKRLSRIVTAVSHDHPEGLKGAECTAMCIFLARKGAAKKQILRRVAEEYYPEVETLSCTELARTYRFDESCQGSVPQAIRCFWEGRDFEDVIRTAISIGGDSDTIAAIAGSIAEAHYGIPKALIEIARLYLDDDLAQLVFNLEHDRA